MKKVSIAYSEYTPLIDAMKYRLSDAEIDILKTEGTNFENYDLVILCDENIQSPNCRYICSHYSLLPAFKGEEPVMQAILEGAKVTGLTIYQNNPFKIIAQYPVFIRNDSHYDDLVQELKYIEQTIFPVIAEKLLRNESFELQNILNTKACGGCSGCKH